MMFGTIVVSLMSMGLAGVAAAPGLNAAGSRRPAIEPPQSVGSATVVSASAPVFVLPDATRIPLRTFKTGDVVGVLEVQTQWVQVDFDDPQFGRRVGFMEKKHLRLIDTPQAAPKGEEAKTAPSEGPAPGREARSLARPAAAAQPVVRNGYVAVNAGYQATANDFTESWTFTAYREASTAQVLYSNGRSVQFDISGSGRVWRDLLVGVGVSRYRHSAAAQASADIAHPFYYAQMRSVEGASSPLARTETWIHMQATWMFAPVRRLHVGVFGGPSVLRLSQPIVTGVGYSDSYPYDTATFAGVTTETQSASKIAFNAGADLAYMFTPVVGVGGLVRFSRAKVALRAPDGGTIQTKAGGLQGGVGLRFAF